MIYTTEEFKLRRDILLNATSQYIFLSSSRVYADSKKAITENSPRLLDVSTDKDYLNSDEYSLAKARQENFITSSNKKNYTIIRPYITYNNQRLQLGVYEKEVWLYRALHGKTIPFSKKIAEKYTTMTYGGDVANGIAKIVGNKKTLGEVFHITSNKAMKWKDILNIYIKVFKNITGNEIKIKYIDENDMSDLGFGYQVTYDRYFERKFNNNKFEKIIGITEFMSPEDGLSKCLKEFLLNPKFQNVSYELFAKMDRMTNENMKLSEISSKKDKIKYIIYRYFPPKIIYYIKKLIKKTKDVE